MWKGVGVFQADVAFKIMAQGNVLENIGAEAEKWGGRRGGAEAGRAPTYLRATERGRE